MSPPDGGNGQHPIEASPPECQGAYCGKGVILAALQRHQSKQDESYLKFDELVESMVGATVRAERAANEAKDSARESSRDALASRAASERIERILTRPINNIVSNYQSKIDSTPPPATADDLLPAVGFGENEIGEITKKQDIRTIYHRAKEAEGERSKLDAEKIRAEEQARRLAEQAELHRLQALEAERVAKAAEAEKLRLEKENELKIEKMKAEAERANLINKAIGAGITLVLSAGSFFTWWMATH